MSQRPDLYTWNDMNESTARDALGARDQAKPQLVLSRPSVFNGPEVTMPRTRNSVCSTAHSTEIDFRPRDNLHKCSEKDYEALIPMRTFRRLEAGSSKHAAPAAKVEHRDVHNART